MEVSSRVTQFPLLLLCVLLFGAWYLRRRRAEPSIASPPVNSVNIQRSVGQIPLVCSFAWMAVPMVVLGSFGSVTQPEAFPPAWIYRSRNVERQIAHPRETGTVATIDSATATRTSAVDSGKRPAWIDQGRVVEGDCERIVLTSGQYTTREEAESELRSSALKLVETDLLRIQNGPFRPSLWRPDPNELIAYAVKDRFEEVIVRDFGTVTHPMHRLSWLVELSPAVRAEFVPAWRRALVAFRIQLVACVASLFAMVVSASVVYFRLDSFGPGGSTGILKSLVFGLAMAWFVLVITTMSRGHLW